MSNELSFGWANGSGSAKSQLVSLCLRERRRGFRTGDRISEGEWVGWGVYALNPNLEEASEGAKEGRKGYEAGRCEMGMDWDWALDARRRRKTSQVTRMAMRMPTTETVAATAARSEREGAGYVEGEEGTVGSGAFPRAIRKREKRKRERVVACSFRSDPFFSD